MRNRFLLLALVLAVGTIVFVQQNATNQTTYNYSNPAQGAPNCKENNHGIFGKENLRCDINSGQEENDNNKEPYRSCDSKNFDKDNDDDGYIVCRGVGNN